MKVIFGKIDFRYEKIYCISASCQSLLCNYSRVLIIIYRVQSLDFVELMEIIIDVSR